MTAFPLGARCMFRTVTASTYWKTGTVTRPPVVNLDGLPVMVDLTDPEGRTWPVAVNNILQTGWESEAA